METGVGDNAFAEIDIRAAVSRAFGVGAATESILADLLTRHAEPHRRYHTAEHVMWVLRHIDRLTAGVTLADRGAVEVAALFHDVVYDPRAGTNESDSADLAADHLRRVGWSPVRIATVERLIVATAGHEANGDDEAVLLDADLAILGASPADYWRYVDRVRNEYAFVDDQRWRQGRADVLHGFVDRERIFATARMADEREAQARTNLAAELVALRSPGA